MLQPIFPEGLLRPGLEEEKRSAGGDQPSSFLQDHLRREGPGRQKIEFFSPACACQMLKPILDDGNALEIERSDQMMEKRRLFFGRFDERYPERRPGDLQDKAGEAGPGPDIDPILSRLRMKEGERRQGIQKMLDDDFAFASESCQIHLSAPPDQFGKVEEELVRLGRRQGDSERRGPRQEERSWVFRNMRTIFGGQFYF